jgi:metallo-beta-lactamase family protein
MTQKSDREQTIVLSPLGLEGSCRIIDGATSVRFCGEEIAVRAHIHTINGFSSHADQRELTESHRRVSGTQRTFLVCGELEAMKPFATKLHPDAIEMPRLYQQFIL